jgi:GDP-L-fucose synthase
MSLPFNTAIIVGSGGFIGGHLSRTLRARGVAVHEIGRKECDLSDAEATDKAFAAAPRSERIFHVATRQRTGEGQFAIQGELLAINSRIHLNVLESWRRRQSQAKLVSAGSSCVYPELDSPIPETMFNAGPLHPSVRGYGLAKEILIVGSETYASQYGLRYLHCIFATVYGPGDHKEEDRSHFMTAMLDRAWREKTDGATSFSVWGAPETVRDLLYVDDQIGALLAADSAFENRIVNCGSNRPVKIGDVASAIIRALDWEIDITYPPGTFRGASCKSIDSSNFLKATGWRPKVELEDGIRRVLQSDY